MQEAGRLETCKQAVINLSEDCLWNLLSSCSNVGEVSEHKHVKLCGMMDVRLPAPIQNVPSICTHAAALHWPI